jgi:hypothetical protein
VFLAGFFESFVGVVFSGGCLEALENVADDGSSGLELLGVTENDGIAQAGANGIPLGGHRNISCASLRRLVVFTATTRVVTVRDSATTREGNADYCCASSL